VSHAFSDIIDDSLVLQYITELDVLGLVPPLATSNELPLHGKVRALKEKRRTRDIGADGMTHIYLYPKDHGNIVVETYETVSFSRGVFAFKGKDWSNKLGIYQFASENRGIDCNRYRINCPPKSYMMALEPSFDLLVLFGTTDEGLALHLRSIQTGLPHPGALFPRILCSSPTGIPLFTYTTIVVEIVGRRIVHMAETSESGTSVITIWDWTSGQIVTSTKVLGYSLAFLSEDMFLVPPPTGYATDDNPHHLALYTCNGVSSGGPARCVARLYFATSDGLQIRCTQFEPSPLPSVRDCSIPLVSPPRVYDTSPASHYITLYIDFLGSGSGRLFIHSFDLLSLVDSLATDHGQCLSVPWLKWGSATSWIHSAALNDRDIACSVFGHLVTCLFHGDDLHDWVVGIFDLRTSKKQALPKPQPDLVSPEEQIEFFLNDGSMSVQYPLLAKSFSIPVGVIPWDDDWYMTTNHQCGVTLMVDDEHIIIFKSPSDTVKASLHIYPL
ncbi:unnamed protein product, partial [Rhizoctonia solani]